MKKITLLLVLFFTFQNFLFSQRDLDCDALKRQNEYLRKALNLNAPLSSSGFELIEFDIVKCEGNSSRKTIVITLLVTNKDETKSSSGRNFKIYDLKGNEYQASNVKLGVESWRYYTMPNDIPVKCTVIFENIQDKILFVKSFSFNITSSKSGQTKWIGFKDLKVEWK